MGRRRPGPPHHYRSLGQSPLTQGLEDPGREVLPEAGGGAYPFPVAPGLALLLFAIPAFAQVAAPVAPPPFVPNMLSAVSVSLQAQPFYGSMLLNAVDFHLNRTAYMPDAPLAAYLKQEILGPAATPKAAAAFVQRLGTEPLTEHRAAALLIANSKARPDQFREVLRGLECLKPGLGRALQARLGGTLQLEGANVVYNRNGELETLYIIEEPVVAEPEPVSRRVAEDLDSTAQS